MRKRLIHTVSAVLCMAFACAFAFSSPPPAEAALRTDDFADIDIAGFSSDNDTALPGAKTNHVIPEPYFSLSSYGLRNPFAATGNYGQCTWYAWGRVREVTGVSLPSGLGNANNWIANARLMGLTVIPPDETPVPGCVAVWQGREYVVPQYENAELTDGETDVSSEITDEITAADVTEAAESDSSKKPEEPEESEESEESEEPGQVYITYGHVASDDSESKRE
ncbi:hypothetical protein FACS1894120_5290 [Clostridia bacterium]|nr:hypothetical protein FACS1894120_5290 [Clostridia bacterium]